MSTKQANVSLTNIEMKFAVAHDPHSSPTITFLLRKVTVSR